jgi:uncharacterized protein (DUF1786 family)
LKEVGVENRLDLAMIFVIPPFVKIVRARLDFIVRSGNNVNLVGKCPLFGGEQGIWR